MKNQPNQTRQISSMRYRRVEEIMRRERAFKDTVAKKTCKIGKRDGTHVCFCAEVVEVTHRLDDAGHDPQRAERALVLLVAHQVISGQASFGSNGLHAPKTPQAPPPTKTPKTPPPPKAKAQAQAKAKTPPPSKTKAPVKTKKVENLLPAHVPPGTAALLDRAKTLPADDRADDLAALPPYYNVMLAIHSLLLTAGQLSGAFERTIGYRNRQQKLDELTLLYEPAPDLSSPHGQG